MWVVLWVSVKKKSDIPGIFRQTRQNEEKPPEH